MLCEFLSEFGALFSTPAAQLHLDIMLISKALSAGCSSKDISTCSKQML